MCGDTYPAALHEHTHLVQGAEAGVGRSVFVELQGLQRLCAAHLRLKHDPLLTWQKRKEERGLLFKN